MASVLNRSQTVEAIERIICEAEKEIVLVTPYLNKRNQSIWNAIVEADQQGKKILLVCRLNDLKADILAELQRLRNLTLYNNSVVHTKCYMNEEELITSSMNLYERRNGTNQEMSTLFYKFDYEDVYSQTVSLVIESKKSGKVIIESFEHGKPYKFKVLLDKAEIARYHLEIINRVSNYMQFSLEPIMWDEIYRWTSSKSDSTAIKDPNLSNFDIYLRFDPSDEYYNDRFTIDRVEIKFQHDYQLRRAMSRKFYEKFDMRVVPGFKVYFGGSLTIYRDWEKYDWHSLTFEESLKRYFNCLPEVFRILKELEKGAIRQLEERSNHRKYRINDYFTSFAQKLNLFRKSIRADL